MREGAVVDRLCGAVRRKHLSHDALQTLIRLTQVLFVDTKNYAIIWDERKRLANLAKHGLDFADFDAGFDWLSAVVRPTAPSSTGRRRLMLIGEMKGAMLVAIVSPLGSEALSRVSLRRADAKERMIYDAG